MKNIYSNTDFKILKNIMDKNDETKGVTRANGSTINELVNKTKLSDKKIRTTLKLFLDDGMVCYGLKNRNSNTYCLTEKGLDEIQSVKTSIM